MPVNYSTSVQPWTLRMPAGSLQQWLFTFTTTAPGGQTPYPITGATWEYVARTSATDLSAPLISLTTSASANGILVVTSTTTLSTVLLEIYPPATASLDGTYAHSLWMNPGGSATAFTWFTGELLVAGNPQP